MVVAGACVLNHLPFTYVTHSYSCAMRVPTLKKELKKGILRTMAIPSFCRANTIKRGGVPRTIKKVPPVCKASLSICSVIL